MPPADRATLGAIWAALCVAACAPGGTLPDPPGTLPPPVTTPGPSGDGGPTTNPVPTTRAPIVPAAFAAGRGWLPLAATGVPEFLAAHPAWDGRGVLIGILDSGIDPGSPGLQWTSTGRPKLLDLRDFSGEGTVALEAVPAEGDTVEAFGRRLAGFGRVRAIAAAGPWYAGRLAELGLGEPGATDLNDNGIDTDTLLVIVARASDGWVLLADTDGDGSLAGERPVHDYLVAREGFGWHRPGEPPPTTLAANFGEEGGRPRLDLVFDNSAHGTHVSGIAAGQAIGGVTGFHGVAPGAQLIGLKISRNDFGGITTTGSMLRALDYGIRFARGRGMPLVFNMSFGVGNEREGAARIDQIIDSVLEANPDVVFVTSAGNDGPGRSTLGFPGSARRAITVGATDPWVLTLDAIRGGAPAPDLLSYFSSRGGELAKPDVVAPGTAFSTVPRWNMGDEIKGGTSMAAPHVAGLAALLASAAREQHREISAEDVRRALAGSAVPLAGATVLDQGAGVPRLGHAWDLLRGPSPPARFDVSVLDGRGVTAAWRVAPEAADSLVRFLVTRRGRAGPLEVTLTSSVPWLAGPPGVRLDGPADTITLVQHAPARPGTWVGAVTATTPGVDGPLFTLVSSVVVPDARRAVALRRSASLVRGGEERLRFATDSERPFRLRVATRSAAQRVVAALFQPGGAPIPGDNGIPAGSDTAAALFDVGGRDARGGEYEAVAAGALGAADVLLAVDHAPVTAALHDAGAERVTVTLTAAPDSAAAGRLSLGLVGGESTVELDGTGGADVSWRVELPAWVRRVVADLELDPGQWPRFTDFGFTLLGADLRILAKQPANYQRTRIDADFPDHAAEGPVTLVLSPGFAEPGSREAWKGRVTLRLYAEAPEAVALDDAPEFRLAPGGSRSWTATVGTPPWELPPGFVPLLLVLEESGGISWRWELPKP